MERNDQRPQIPFVKPVRIGNFRLWRSRYTIKDGREKADIECLHVSSLDGAWMVRIPSTMSLFAVICDSYATTDTEMRDGFLSMVFTNMYNIGTSASAALHDGFFLLSEMMTFPYLLLPEKEMRERMEKGMKELGIDKAKRREHISRMCEYRRELYSLIDKKLSALISDYEAQQAERRAMEEESMKKVEQDELAEQAAEVLQQETETEHT